MKIDYYKISVFVLGLLWIYAGISKLLDYNNFIVQLDQSPLIPNSLISLVAIIIPFFEILIAIGLCFDQTQKISSVFSFGLMFFFTLYLIFLVSFFENVPCSCGGIIGKMSYPVHIAFNITFTIIAAFILKKNDKKK